MTDSVGTLSVVGGECTGKTTLGLALAARLPGLYVPEYLRVFVDEQGRAPGRDEQRRVLAGQAGAEAAAALAAARDGLDWVIADAGPLMTAVYSRLYYDDESLDGEALTALRGARLVVWCAPDLAWIADPGQRDGPQYRAAADEVLAQMLATSDVPVVRVAGDVDQRVEAVRSALVG